MKGFILTCKNDIAEDFRKRYELFSYVTHHALIVMTEMIRATLDNKRFGCGVFIDLQKAFDTVNHNILIAKLENYGVRGNVLKWFKSYLCNRDEYVSINGINSTPLRVTSGVPQGSVFGPLLFLIFVNNMPNILKKFKFYLFADDTSIYYEPETLNETIKQMNKELKLEMAGCQQTVFKYR